ncbi:MAG TPA: fumarylacetoacetate hydrolase family protein [Xanthobacteraceae bacterium]|jgi:2-keto-4-pentenoate hydratase/2-oxohepta-3-ene-1,7-dioic acid hydratase in catechol pathway
MSHIAIAAYKRTAQARPAMALSIDNEIYDLEAARNAGVKIGELGVDGGLPALLAQWCGNAALTEACEDIRQLVERGKLQAVRGGPASLTAPFLPERIFCAAANYIEHAKEMGSVLAGKSHSKPYMFIKLRNTVIGPGEAIRMPPETSQLDWEVELAAVIGRGGRRIPLAQALDHVGGYAIVNDISARDLNVRGDYPFKFDWFQGKCHDTFAPFGPWIVPAFAVPDPQALAMELEVNGQIMQKDSTGNMIWTVREQIAYLSTIVTLEPGDVIATGTPTGVGMARGIFLKAGDVVSASIGGIGTLTNSVVAETL